MPFKIFALLLFVLVIPASIGHAQELTIFESREGAFKILLPGSPELVMAGEQHQHLVPLENGLVIVLYQDMYRADAKQALESVVNMLLKTANGDVSEDRTFEYESHPARYFASTVNVENDPSKRLRTNTYFVGGRLYCVTVIGSTSFVESELATKILESFEVTEVNMASRLLNK